MQLLVRWFVGKLSGFHHQTSISRTGVPFQLTSNEPLETGGMFPGLGSVLPYRLRDVGFTDFDE